AERGAVRVVDCVVIAAALGLRRDHDHPDRAAAVFIPSDEDCAVVAVRCGGENHRNGGGQPGVAPRDVIAGGTATAAVHVTAEVGGDEVVARGSIALQVTGQL